MTLAKQTRGYLKDIQAAARKAQEFMGALQLRSFLKDEKTAFAVIRALEIMGEATKRVPAEVREQHSGIPWKAMAGIRDKLIHDYAEVDLEVVWKTVRDDLPTLMVSLDKVLSPRKSPRTKRPRKRRP